MQLNSAFVEHDKRHEKYRKREGYLVQTRQPLEIFHSLSMSLFSE